MTGLDRLKARQSGTVSPTNNVIDLLNNPALMTKTQTDDIQQIPIANLHDFGAHTFLVREDETYKALVSSITETGIRTPLLVRPYPVMGDFEIISGHRRRRAAQDAGLETVPCIVVRLDDDEATILMAESNIQRPDWLPSEKAKTFTAWLEAVQKKTGISQGQRSDRTSGTEFPKFGSTPSGATSGTEFPKSDSTPADATAGTGFPQTGRNRDVAAAKWGISGKAFSMYIKLCDLLPELLDMVDNGQIAVKAGYQLAFLPLEHQHMVLSYLSESGKKLNPAKASELRKASSSGDLDESYLEQLLESKTVGKVNLSFTSDVLLNKKTIKTAMNNASVMEKIEAIIKQYAIDHNLPLS